MSKTILGKYYSVQSLNNEVEECTYPCTDSLMLPLGSSRYITERWMFVCMKANESYHYERYNTVKI